MWTAHDRELAAGLERDNVLVEVLTGDESVSVIVGGNFAGLERRDERIKVVAGQESVAIKVGEAGAGEETADFTAAEAGPWMLKYALP